MRASPSPEDSWDGPPRLSGAAASQFVLLTCKKLVRGGDTWSGTHTATGAAVIAKRVRVPGASNRLRTRLRRQAEVLQELGSPFVVPLLHFEDQGDVHCLVMPELTGDTLAARLGRGPLPLRDALAIGRCVLAGLADLHALGVLHRDVSPANVIVAAGPDGPRAILIDVGIARTDLVDLSERELPLGTAAYLSPEQAGLLDREVGPSSDLYALGALLFHCIVGEPPFAGPTLGDVLRQHVVRAPGDLRVIAGAPRAVNDVVQRLLLKDPRDRYQSAAAARDDLDAIVRLMARGVAEPEIVVGASDARPTLTEPCFLGRATELDALDRELARTRAGSRALVLLEAESGGGKSRLLDEWAQRCRREGALVLRGRGVSETAARPFQLLADIAEDLVRAAHLAPELSERVTTGVGDVVLAVRAALPELAPLLDADAESGAVGREVHGETRSLSALATLFDALGTREAPAIVLLDDGQWADEMTVRMLLQWSRGTGDTATCVVVAFRSEEVDAEHPLRALPATARIRLGTFGPADVDRIAQSAAGSLPEDALAVVRALSAGNPFMVSAVVTGLVETGALVRGEAGWRTDPAKLEQVQSSRRAAALLRRRLDVMPEDTRALLSTGAVLGKEFDLDLASYLADLSPECTLRASDDARRRLFVWLRPTTGRAMFVHDKLRETLLAKLPLDARREIHRRAALRLEATSPDRTFELAYHFDAADEPSRALPYALAAGDRARAQHALELAEKQYRIAERAASAEPDTRRVIAEALGDVLMLRGRYEEADLAFQRAEARAESRVQRATLEGKRGELAFKRGNVREASAAIERALEILGCVVPRHPMTLVVMLAWELVVQLVHTTAPRLALGRRTRAGADARFAAIRLYSRAAYAYWFERGKLACLWAHLRGMNLAERYPETPELAQAYSEHAPVMTMIPWFSRGLAYGERSLAIRRALGDVWGQGQSLAFLGTVLYAAGRFDDVKRACGEAVRLLERTGDLWEANTAKWHVAFAEQRLGNLDEARRVSQEVYRSGQEIGDPQASGIALGCWARASGGRVPEEYVQAALQRGTDDAHTFAEVAQAAALRHVSEGRHEAAVAELERADHLIRKKGLQQDYVAAVLPLLATALRLHAEDVSAFAPAAREEVLRRAAKATKRARRVARLYPNNRSHALRESGLLAALRGDGTRARRFLDDGLAAAERLGMRHERALTLAARAEVGAGLGWSTAADDARAARRLERDLGLGRADEVGGIASEVADGVSLSLADRFPRVLDAGHRIATALTPERVLDATRDAAMTLLRCTSCFVEELPDDGRARAVHRAGDVPPTMSASTVKAALDSGRVIVVSEGVPDVESDSLVLSGARSILCAPIQVRGRPVAMLYATHEDVAALFGPTEERLAQFIAAVASAALENAEGFVTMQELSEERARLYAQAQQALETRDEFLAVASHELRTPLTALGLGVSILMRDAGDMSPRQTARLQKISDQVKRLVSLVENLLDVTRLERGRIDLAVEPLDLSEVGAAVVDRLQPTAERAGSELVLVAGERILGAWDRMRLEQILTNLCSNAVKFGAGKPVDVVIERAPDGGARVVVVDRGVGIRAEDQARIFGRFERAVAARHHGGLGLGLWIVRQLVERMGGTVHVESTPGAGSRFVVHLPDETPVSQPGMVH